MILPPPSQPFEVEVDTLVIGAGACGLVAGLAAQEAGDTVLLVERDPVPRGSTALSAGLIPAARTRFQREAGISDTPDRFAADIMAKAGNEPDPEIVAALAGEAAATIEWLADRFGLPFTVVSDFDYPGHSARRMHGLLTRSGSELMDHLRSTAEAEGLDIITDCRATGLFADDEGRVLGARVARPDGTEDDIGCARLILACNGFGGNTAMVAEEMPDIADAIYFGHTGNQGDAVTWGKVLGAATRHLGSYQGHGNVAHPHGILITWAVITEGGIQINSDGHRFWDESQGYSEAARAVLAQPGGIAWAIFDDRIAGIARQFADFKDAEAQGAVHTAQSLGDLAARIGLPKEALVQTVKSTQSAPDPFGRKFDPSKALSAPYNAVKVTAALFHTQGGLDVTPDGRVKRASGGVLANLFAAGGAACGVSGAADSGYLSGNGLLSAVVLGHLAGRARLNETTQHT